jgi:hypothetical protein
LGAYSPRKIDPIQNNNNSDGILVTNRSTPGPPGQRSEILKKTGDKTTQRCKSRRCKTIKLFLKMKKAWCQNCRLLFKLAISNFKLVVKSKTSL